MVTIFTTVYLHLSFSDKRFWETLLQGRLMQSVIVTTLDIEIVMFSEKLTAKFAVNVLILCISMVRYLPTSTALLWWGPKWHLLGA